MKVTAISKKTGKSEIIVENVRSIHDFGTYYKINAYHINYPINIEITKYWIVIN